MTSSFGRTPADVRNWPADPAARQALLTYLEALPRDSQDVPQALAGSDLDFTGADLSGLDLSSAGLGATQLSGVRLVGADLYGAWLVEAVLRGADLSECDLRKVQGRTCDARNAIFHGAQLERADFEDSDFRGADLSGVRFGRASLSGADLRGADLRDCVFGTAVGPADLWQARLAGSQVAGATGSIAGPVDIGADAPHLIDGGDLRGWFASHGALLAEVKSPTP
ncbi:MAG TPA: pentapeptide repeat-containing protein [Trebonia sp.]|jgi:uncharacterized protein YjbI with pentapeptide repeats|nr:pentapeptide repeat-containing protein [Trebonia sp.]